MFGPQGDFSFRFVLDTGTPVTLVSTAVADGLGYSARMGVSRSRLLGVGGLQEGYRLTVDRLETLGFVASPCDVFCHDFDEHLGVDGLIGMDLLEGRVLTLDGIRGVIQVDS